MGNVPHIETTNFVGDVEESGFRFDADGTRHETVRTVTYGAWQDRRVHDE